MLMQLLVALFSAAAGVIPGGLVVRFLLLGDRPRTGFDGVAEVFWGVAAGAILFGIVGFFLAGRMEPGRRWIGLLVAVALIVIEVVAFRMLGDLG